MANLPSRPKTRNLPATADSPGKTILTDELIAGIVDNIRRGHFVLQACLRAGIAKETYYDWLDKANKDPKKYPQCVKLSDAIKDARLGDEDSLVSTMHEIAIKDRNAKVIGWLLERKYPTRWARRTRFDIAAPAPSNPDPAGTYQTNIVIVLPDNGMRVSGPLALAHESQSNTSNVKKDKKRK